VTVRAIRTWPDEVLRRSADRVERFDEELRRLVDDMLETMYAAPGIGLAAPQVGVSRRVIVIDLSSRSDPAQVLALANPEIVEAAEEIECDEGCLSLPEFNAKVRRARRVTVRGQDLEGRPVEIRGEDLLARALQHEIDHTEGRLLLDRVGPLHREIAKKKLRKAHASLHDG
jgi:peptide deformylase